MLHSPYASVSLITLVLLGLGLLFIRMVYGTRIRTGRRGGFVRGRERRWERQAGGLRQRLLEDESPDP